MRKRRLCLEPLESRHLLTSVTEVANVRLDVNDDGAVTPLDALLILNVVNESAQSQALSVPALRLEDSATAVRHAAYDLNLDGLVGPADALMVINGLGRSPFNLPDVPTGSEEPRGRALHAALPGDFNLDCEVDAADHELWASTYGSTSQLAADGNGDGIVDAADFNVWREGHGVRRCIGGDIAFWSLTNVEFSDRSLHAMSNGDVDIVPSTEDDIIWEVAFDEATGTVTLKDIESGDYLAATGFRVFMVDDVTDIARWILVDHPDGSLRFQNLATGRYFDGDGAADGWSVQESLDSDADTRWRPNVWTLPSSPAVSFAMIGDNGTGVLPSIRVADLVNRSEPNFVLAAGDTRYVSLPYDTPNGMYCDYQSNVLAGPVCPSGGNSVPNRFFATPGNHDYTDGGGIAQFREYFDMPGRGSNGRGTSGSELYYDVIQGPVHIFAVDSQAVRREPGSYADQLAWLEASLAASTSPWQVVVIHHAPYSSSPTHGSDGIMQFPFANWGVDLVLGAHIHNYERVQRDGTTFVVNGLAGPTPYPLGLPPLWQPIEGSVGQYNATHGASFFEATETTLTGRFVNVDGYVIDSFSVAPSVPGQPVIEHDLTLVGRVFADANLNGVQDVGESGLSGVSLFMDEFLDGTRSGEFDPGEPSAITDENGDYQFSFATPREYQLYVDVPEGYANPSRTVVGRFETGRVEWGRVDVFGTEPTVVDFGFGVVGGL